jgi:hypothetical protein
MKDHYSLKAFKLIIDYSLIDVNIPIEYLSFYIYKKFNYRNKILNLAIISEFLMKNIKLRNFLITKFERHYIYNEIFHIAFQSQKQTNFFYEKFTETKYKINIENHKTILNIAKKYCENEENLCMNNVLTKINLKVIDRLVKETIVK